MFEILKIKCATNDHNNTIIQAFRPSYVVFVLYKDYIFITKKNFVLLPFTQFIEVQVGVLDWISGF